MERIRNFIIRVFNLTVCDYCGDIVWKKQLAFDDRGNWHVKCLEEFERKTNGVVQDYYDFMDDNFPGMID